MPASANRRKISTTVSAETHRYLERLVSQGRVKSMAEAVDLSVARARRLDNRIRLEQATAAYFDGLSPEALEDENRLATALSSHFGEIDIDE